MAEREVVFKMFDFQFDWKDDLNTGVEDIDRQHRELFRIGRDIEQLILTGCVGVGDKELLKIICDLREYVSYHFYEEEKFMKSHNYKDYEVHKKSHEDVYKRQLIYVPLAHRVFPTTFLIGIILMSFLMSFAQMLLRTSTTWIFGFIFCIYYEGVLLWQMPIAWVTFWKSTWGTRMTPSDVEAEEKKKNRRDKRREGKP